MRCKRIGTQLVRNAQIVARNCSDVVGWERAQREP